MGWITPTSHNDPWLFWVSETNAYDDNTATFAESGTVQADTWMGIEYVLELNHAALTCNKVRVWIEDLHGKIDLIDLDVYKDGAWVDVYQGALTKGEWFEKSFTSGSVTKMRARFHAASGNDEVHWCEADFWEVAGVSHYKTVTEILGLTDSHAYSKWTHHKKTVTELLGLVDSKVYAHGHYKTVSEKLGLIDTWDKNKCPKCKPTVIIMF